MYLLLEPSFFDNMHDMLPAALPDIESEICIWITFPKKNRVSGSKLSNPQLMLTVSSVP